MVQDNGLWKRKILLGETLMKHFLHYICDSWEPLTLGFRGSSAGKESVCKAGDPRSIPGLRRSPGEGIGYPLQYFGASLVAQRVKNSPAMQETWIQFLGWEDALEEGWQHTPVFLPRESPCTDKPGGLQSIGLQGVRHDRVTKCSKGSFYFIFPYFG